MTGMPTLTGVECATRIQDIRLEDGRATRVIVLGVVNLPDRHWVVGETRDGRVVKGKPLHDRG